VARIPAFKRIEIIIQKEKKNKEEATMSLPHVEK
jgi:hypothetical protein